MTKLQRIVVKIVPMFRIKDSNIKIPEMYQNMYMQRLQKE